MNEVCINGMTIRGGCNVMAINGRIIVDGKDVTAEVAKTGFLDVSTGATAPEGLLAWLLRLFKLR